MNRRPRRIVLRGAALVCAAGSATGIALGLRDDRPAAATEPRGRSEVVTTPLGSPRRVRALFVDAIARARFTRALTAFVAPVGGCVVVDGPAGWLARIRADLPLAPASTEKLLTAAAALATFGPGHRLTTRAVTNAPVDGGVLRGDVTVVGGGDPLLATPEHELRLHARDRTRTVPVTRLADLADAIAATGVRRVDGALVGDDTRHDTLRFLPDWKPSYRTEGQVGPLGALTVDGGFTDPARPTVASDPALLTVQRLRELLAARGVAVAGGVRRGRAPRGARDLALVRSPSLADVVGEMLTSSDNYTAELLTREIGLAREGRGTTAAGTRTIVDAVAVLGVPTQGVELHDGSGLAPNDRVTCDAILYTLELATRPGFDAIDRGLAVAARTGTLATRFRGDPLAGELRAKTGQIEGVVGLAGVVDDAEHARFAFLANGGFSTGAGEALQVEVARLVAAYPQLAGTDTLLPPPAPPRRR